MEEETGFDKVENEGICRDKFESQIVPAVYITSATVSGTRQVFPRYYQLIS